MIETRPNKTREECQEWLRELLSGGSKHIWFVRRMAEIDGFTPYQLLWAKYRLRVETTRLTEDYSWELPP